MRPRLLLLSILCSFWMMRSAWASCPSRTYSYTTGQTIDPSQVTTNEDSLFTYSCAVDTFAAGSVNAAALADNAVTSAKINDGTIVNADISSSAAITYGKLSFSNNIVAGDIAAGAVDAGDMATTGTIADDKVFVADSATAGTWRTIPNCTDTGGNHTNYTQATNSWSCGTSSSSGATSVATGSFTRAHDAASGTQTVSGLGITPTMVWVSCVTAGSSQESRGFSNSTTDGSIWNNGGGTPDTWEVSTTLGILIAQTGSLTQDGNLGNFVSGAFDVVWTRTGATAAGTITCIYAAIN